MNTAIIHPQIIQQLNSSRFSELSVGFGVQLANDGKPELTVISYLNALRRFRRFLDSQGRHESIDQSLRSADDPAINAFKAYLIRQNYQGASRHHTLSILRKFYTWLKAEGQIEAVPPTLQRKQAKCPRPQLFFLSRAQLDGAIAQLPVGPRRLRVTALVELIVGGARPLSYFENFTLVQGENAIASRRLDGSSFELPTRTIAALQSLVDHKRLVGASDSDALFKADSRDRETMTIRSMKRNILAFLAPAVDVPSNNLGRALYRLGVVELMRTTGRTDVNEFLIKGHRVTVTEAKLLSALT